MLCLSAICIVVVGLGMLNMCHIAVAERLDAMQRISSVDSCRKPRSTSMSSCEAGLLAENTKNSAIEPLLAAANSEQDKLKDDSVDKDSDVAVVAFNYSFSTDSSSSDGKSTTISRGTVFLSGFVNILHAGGLVEYQDLHAYV